MTVTMLREAGVAVDDATPNRWVIQPGPVAARHWDIEPDLSNAVPFLAAAVVTAGTVRITGLAAGQRATRPTTILDLLDKAGATVHQGDSHLEVKGPSTATRASTSTCTRSASWHRRSRRWQRWPSRVRCRT